MYKQLLTKIKEIQKINNMELNLEKICRLYYRYKRTSDDYINTYLNYISIVRFANKGKMSKTT